MEREGTGRNLDTAIHATKHATVGNDNKAAVKAIYRDQGEDESEWEGKEVEPLETGLLGRNKDQRNKERNGAARGDDKGRSASCQVR